MMHNLGLPAPGVMQVCVYYVLLLNSIISNKCHFNWYFTESEHVSYWEYNKPDLQVLNNPVIPLSVFSTPNPEMNNHL